MADGVAPGARYCVRSAGRPRRAGSRPRASSRDGVEGPSEVVDPTAYAWTNAGWTGRPWEEAVDLRTACRHLHATGHVRRRAGSAGHLADLGVTAVEIMPVAAFGGTRGWGYDGVLPYAPHAAYGGPEAMKAFIDAAHGRGLMVLLDVVYNHFGPEGNFLSPLRARLLPSASATRPGDRRSPTKRTRCAASSSRTRSTGLTSSTSTGCASMRSTRSRTNARTSISWSRSPSACDATSPAATST